MKREWKQIGKERKGGKGPAQGKGGEWRQGDAGGEDGWEGDRERREGEKGRGARTSIKHTGDLNSSGTHK